jgi:glutathione peroxidase-family protein
MSSSSSTPTTNIWFVSIVIALVTYLLGNFATQHLTRLENNKHPQQPPPIAFHSSTNQQDSVTMAANKTFFDFTVKDSPSPSLRIFLFPCWISNPANQPTHPAPETGADHPLSKYNGKVVLVVNTASKCGFTPQYAGLEKLYKSITAEHPDQFVILGFPCNQFGNQEPGSNDEIQQFCQVNYGVTFPVLGKVDVNGPKADPVFVWLKKETPRLFGMMDRIVWNFEKFLVGKDGKVIARWSSMTKPETLEADILKALKAWGGGNVQEGFVWIGSVGCCTWRMGGT